MNFQIPFPILVTHVLTGLGETCTDISKDLITNEAECKAAVEGFSKTYISARDTRFYPTGCFIYNDFIGYFNTHENGKGHSKINAICKEGKLTKLINHLLNLELLMRMYH